MGGVTGGLALGVDPALAAETPVPAAVETVAGLPRRVLGRTGQKLSVVGFPGLALVHYDQKQCDEGIRKAFDRGINYFDVAPAYGNGVCETKLGIGLQGLDRSSYFLACKTKMRDQEGARKELENSLKLLKTDHFDLYQMHHLVKPADVKRALGPGGAIETFLKAREEGKVKYLGFSAHSTKGALEALKGFRFDTAMFPINFVEFYLRDFGKEVMELANQQGAAILAIKPMSLGAWAKEAKRTRQWWYRSVEEPQRSRSGVAVHALRKKGWLRASRPRSSISWTRRSMPPRTTAHPPPPTSPKCSKSPKAVSPSSSARKRKSPCMATRPFTPTAHMNAAAHTGRDGAA